MGTVRLSEELYRALTGKTYGPFTVAVTAERIRSYAEATGDNDPIRHDRSAARAAGYRDIVAPPTLGFTLLLMARQPDLALADFGLTVNEALHGEQSFTYGAPICAGDILTGSQRITDVREKKRGTLLLVVTVAQLGNELGEQVLETSLTSIVPLVRLRS